MLIDFDTDPPTTSTGDAHDPYDMYYDHEYPDRPSAYFRVNDADGGRLGRGPDSMPQDPDECLSAVSSNPMPNYLPQHR